MKTYKELVDELYEEVSKIDVSKLSLSAFGGLKEYVELLKVMSSLPSESAGNMDYVCNSQRFTGLDIPKKDKS